MGLRSAYLAVSRQEDLSPPGGEHRDLVALVAARLGRARLIDNFEFRI